MKSNLYQYFNCENKEDLYLKLKNNDKEVKELSEYLEYAKKDLDIEKIRFQGRDKLKEYLKNNVSLNKNEVQILMLDSNFNLQKDTKIDIDSSFKEIMKESYDEKARSVILLYHEGDIDKIITNKDKIQELENNLEIADYRILEILKIDNDLRISSNIDEQILTLQEEYIINQKAIQNHSKDIEIVKAPEYNEFMDYYAKKELPGLDVAKDKERIKEILKVSYQESNQENFGVIKYDKDYKVTDINILFKGGITKAFIDPKILIPTLLDEQVKGIEIFHNHPSQSPTPSQEDINSTELLQRLAENLDKELLDHYIVAKESVFSFKDEWLLEEKKDIGKNYEISKKEPDIKNEKKNKFKEEREKFVDAVIKSLESGKIPWEKDWNNVSGPIQNPITGTKYRGINNIRLYATMIKKGYTDNRWVTFKQAQKEEWKIRKGEKGTSIEIFKYYDKLTKKDLDREMLRTLSLEKQREYWVKNVYPMGKTYVVFNAEQIEGIPPLEHKKVEIDYNKLDKIIENSGVTFKYGGNEAYYNKAKDMIVLPRKEQFKTEAAFYGTALHELAHSTGHEARLNRTMKGNFGSEKYAREELVAEFASVFIGQEKGVGYTQRNLENSKAYIQNWIDVLKNDKNELFTAIKDAEKASEMVMGYELGKELNIDKSKNKGIER
ncbi:zincin-like metallopeptidase domain-containing protein [Fusobacterium ulcerans]|uniref:zincin-like metallopeptidase domain-containing protein n=1 Tax=Fusobacterium ulcerans TaxID=861 RepID=UPI002E7A3380|nr:zincin-like metallopeptidase domain-containing protein [Fusobacterium ulcerans]MEE0137721.1 zincin-like metallopeptidase domain-containing protein [Fusobacterium ulcerans]